MPSTYTTNLNIEKPAAGEQLNTWGTTVNINFDILDQSINGISTITLASAGTSGSPNTLTVPIGETSEGRNKYITFTDSGSDLGADAYVQLTPSTAQKVAFIRNNLSNNRNVILFQGTYAEARRYVLPPSESQIIAFSGGPVPVVTKVTTPTYFDINNLTDVTIATPSNGQVLSYNSTSGDWENTTPATVITTLNGLTDVSVGDLSNGQALTYNTSAGVWSNTTLPTVITTINGLTDVSVTEPSNGQVLSYNSTSGDWENTTPATVITTLNGLTDVSVGDLSNGQALTYNTSAGVWSNTTLPTVITTINGLTDVSVTEPSNGQVLSYNSTSGDWENTTPATPTTPTLDAVTDAGNSTTNQITVSGVNIGNWTIELDGSDLRFMYNDVDVFRITTTGAIIAKDDVTAFGAP